MCNTLLPAQIMHITEVILIKYSCNNTYDDEWHQTRASALTMAETPRTDSCAMNQLLLTFTASDVSARTDWHADGPLCSQPTSLVSLFIHFSVHLSVTEVMKTIFSKQMNYFDANWHKWSTEQCRKTINFEGQGSKVKVRWSWRQIWSLVGASFWTNSGLVAFLVWINYNVTVYWVSTGNTHIPDMLVQLPNI